MPRGTPMNLTPSNTCGSSISSSRSSAGIASFAGSARPSVLRQVGFGKESVRRWAAQAGYRWSWGREALNRRRPAGSRRRASACVRASRYSRQGRPSSWETRRPASANHGLIDALRAEGYVACVDLSGCCGSRAASTPCGSTGVGELQPLPHELSATPRPRMRSGMRHEPWITPAGAELTTKVARRCAPTLKCQEPDLCLKLTRSRRS